jgi:2,4-dienoyl-CoA reductase (NADPH2)
MYKNLLSPIAINKLEIRNRVVYPSLGLLYSYDGTLNDRYYAYFREKARGGTGLVTVGPVGIDFIGSGKIIPMLDNDEAIPAFKKMASIIKEEGARAWIQLFHAGAYSYPILLGEEPPIAPSAVYSRYSKAMPREMTIEDIEKVQEAFVSAAARAQEAGFDGVEILGSGGYLITQFLSTFKNQRTDEYGGSFENRVRFPREVIERTRMRLGADFPLTIRMAGNDFVAGSNTDSETKEFAKVYEAAGVDAISVTGGWHETHVPQLPASLPQSGFAFLAYNIKKEVSVPVMASNRISSPEVAEKLLKDGYADMVSIGRGLIADPQWVNKAMVGKSDEIRPCVACLQGCMDNVMSGKPVTCVANPMAGYEGVRKIEKCDTPKNVMIVGAGMAGLEAAITAAKAGHHVDLYEMKDEIGGQLWIAGAPPHKSELLGLVDYYQAMLWKHNVSLHLNTKVDDLLIREKNPDFLIVAEGAEPLLPPIDGIDDPSVISAWDLLKNDRLLGNEVAIIGGGAVGLETALKVAAKGTITPEVLHFLFAHEAESVERLRELMFNGTSKVTVFEMLPKVGKDVGKSTKWVLMSDLEKYGVELTTEAKVISIKNGLLTYEKDGRQYQRQFDSIINAAGSKSVKNIAEKVEKLNIPFAVIGDGAQPGKMNHAVHGGFLAAIEIG